MEVNPYEKKQLKSRWCLHHPPTRLTQLFLINRINNHLQRYEKHSFEPDLYYLENRI